MAHLEENDSGRGVSAAALSLGPCGASDGGARTEQCRLVPRKMGDLADCRGSSGCVLRRVLVELMLNIGLKGILFGRTLPS